jgi:hypothetical protein
MRPILLNDGQRQQHDVEVDTKGGGDRGETDQVFVRVLRESDGQDEHECGVHHPTLNEPKGEDSQISWHFLHPEPGALMCIESSPFIATDGTYSLCASNQ